MPHSTELGRPTQHRFLFLHLPDDVLFLICAHLELEIWLPVRSVSRFEEHFRGNFLIGKFWMHPLIQLSRTCRALRRLCLPRVFRLLSPHDSPVSDAWPSALVHTQGILLGGARIGVHQLHGLLRMAGDIREVHFRDDVTLLPHLLQLPSLGVLSTSEVRWAEIRSSLPLPEMIAPLRILRICLLDRPADLACRPADLSWEIEWISELATRLRSTLEVLALPAESVRISVLTTSPWPKLRELVLYGCCPILDAALPRIFDVLPRLHAFTLAVALNRGHDPLILWPQGSGDAPYVSGMRRFTISPPSPFDDIFVHLPPELEELSLRDMPRFYHRYRYPEARDPASAPYEPRILTCRDALLIFQSLRCCAALRNLELVVLEDEHELELLAFVADACPRLAFFEFHCYRNVSAYTDLIKAPMAVPLDVLAAALSAFAALRVVRLNLDLPWNKFTVSPYSMGGRHDGFQYASTIAQTVAEAVPWLDAVCVLTRQSLHVWRMWTVKRHDGEMTLEEIVVIHGTVAYGNPEDF